MKKFLCLLPLVAVGLCPPEVAAQSFVPPLWSDQQPAQLLPHQPPALLQTDTAGNTYVAATVLNPATGDADVALWKYGCNGAFQWRRTYDHLAAAQDDRLAGLDLDAAGNIYLGLTAAAGTGGGDWVVVKFDGNGNTLWRAWNGTPGYDRLVGVAVDARGAVALAGEFDGGRKVAALRLNFLNGSLLGPIAETPTNAPPTTAQAMTLDGAGNVWVVGTAGPNCHTLRFGRSGAGLAYSGSALSPGAWTPARGQALAWSASQDRIFVLAAVGGNGLPTQQAVLCYLNSPGHTIPLATDWHADGEIPGAYLKPLPPPPGEPAAESPLALGLARDGSVLTLASRDRVDGQDWLVTGWDAVGNLVAETESTLGPTSPLHLFNRVAPAALAVDAAGRACVTGTGQSALTQGHEFVTARYAALHSPAALSLDWFNFYAPTSGENRAAALGLDPADNVLVTGASATSTNTALTTFKLCPGTPANDACAQARPVSAGTVAFTTCQATETQPPAGTCNASRQDVWFRWTAPGNGWVEVDTFGSCFDTVLAVYTGTCGALSLVPGACNDNATAGRPIGTAQSFVGFMAVAGTTYLIQVGGGGVVAASGDGRLTIFGPLPPLGTCPPGGRPGGIWRKFAVLGNGNSSAGGVWRITVPNCTDVLGHAPTAEGDSPATLAAKLAASINGACGPARISALALGPTLLLQVAGCPPDQPFFFRVGPAGTPPNQLCLVPDVRGDDVLDPVAPPFCTYNPILMGVQVGPDCNGNGIPDEVDIASGASQDSNTNGIPDECEGGLRIRWQTDHVVLMWGLPAYLEASPSLSTPDWQTVPGTSPLVLPADQSERYFRLQPLP